MSGLRRTAVRGTRDGVRRHAHRVGPARAGAGPRGHRPAGAGAELALLIELRAALAGGVTPAAALLAAAEAGSQPPGRAAVPADGFADALAAAARQLRLGGTLEGAAAELGSATPAGLLLASLAISERTGNRASTAVDQAIEAVTERRRLAQLLEVRSTQARGTAVILSAVPIGAWGLLLLADPAALRFYLTPLGLLTAVAAVALVTAGWRWARRILDHAERAGAEADPLAVQAPPRDAWRGTVAAAPVAIAAAVLAGPLAAAAAGGAVWVWASKARLDVDGDEHAGADRVDVPAGAGARSSGSRGVTRRDASDTGGGRRRAGVTPAHGGGAAGAVDLLAAAIEGGLGPMPAIRTAAPLVPPEAGVLLDAAARRLGAGVELAEAFAGTPLAPVGAVLAAGARWGAPTAPALRRLAAEWRVEQRLAAEAAAERAQLALVFPTTLLTLPAFALVVVPPLLWTALAR